MTPPASTPACATCGGVRWVAVTAAYAERRFPMPEPPANRADPAEAAAFTALVAKVVERRAAARDSWFPCRECNKAAFFRWANKHWDPDHDRSMCDDCQDVAGPPRRQRRRSLSGVDNASRAAGERDDEPDFPPSDEF